MYSWRQGGCTEPDDSSQMKKKPSIPTILHEALKIQKDKRDRGDCYLPCWSCMQALRSSFWLIPNVQYVLVHIPNPCWWREESQPTPPSAMSRPRHHAAADKIWPVVRQQPREPMMTMGEGFTFRSMPPSRPSRSNSGQLSLPLFCPPSDGLATTIHTYHSFTSNDG